MIGAYRVLKKGVFKGDFWVTMEQGDTIVVEQDQPQGLVHVHYMTKTQLTEALCRGDVVKNEEMELVG